MDKYFELNRNVSVEYDKCSVSIVKAAERFFRDMEMTLCKTDRKGRKIFLHVIEKKMEIGDYKIYFDEKENMQIEAYDDLGIIYALLYLSEVYLEIQPFWFWNDQEFTEKEFVQIPLKEVMSPQYRVKYRGWFLNDEVLISHWEVENDSAKPWEMAMEALLRCGGNMIIPGTDKNSKIYTDLASEMGLYITHHHAEPLGAEMFARAYPTLNPSYDEHKELFQELWRDGIEKQKEKKIIWNLGFRGQGDVPFWKSDAKYDSDESRGALISSIIKYQYELVCELVENPICCTNLYGEIMELYQKGHIKLPKDIIFIWADNGFGKMVSRRQGNHNPRIEALPQKEQKEKRNGAYYHVSFYDLQAANHITMLPNSIEFVDKEFEHSYEMGIRDFWIINSSNIKPHVYYLNYISKLWKSKPENSKKECVDYIYQYYTKEQEQAEQIWNCFDEYAKRTLSSGKFEDERCGEQFYNYTVRIFLYYWKMNQIESGAKELRWAIDGDFSKQINGYEEICLNGLEGFKQLYQKCDELAKELEERKDSRAKRLFEDSIFLQTKIHVACIQGSLEFCKAFRYNQGKQLTKAFYHVGRAAEEFDKAVQAMKEAGHDKWKGFYDNDCLADVKQTVYLLKQMMGHIRNIGDGPHFYEWQREFLYKEEDKRVVLITNMENHLTDEELLEQMKKKYESEIK